MLRYLMTRTWMSVLGLVVAVAVAIPTYIHLGHRLLCAGDGLHVAQGANVDLACLLVGVSGSTAALASYVARTNERALAAVLLLGAVTLAVAIGLVAADSATHAATWSDFGLCRDSDGPWRPEVKHVDWLFAVWGVPLVPLLVRAYGAWKGIERPDADELREQRRSKFSVPQV